MSRNGDIYTTRLPSWSWKGWYTKLKYAAYDAEEAQKSIEESASHDTDRAAEWFCVDTAEKLSKLEQSPWHDHQRHGMFETFRRPVWVENRQEPDIKLITADEMDFGRITAWTSYAYCHIQTRSFDAVTRRDERAPRDGFEYDVLNSEGRIIGRLYSVELISPAEESNEIRVAE